MYENKLGIHLFFKQIDIIEEIHFAKKKFIEKY